MQQNQLREIGKVVDGLLAGHGLPAGTGCQDVIKCESRSGRRWILVEIAPTDPAHLQTLKQALLAQFPRVEFEIRCSQDVVQPGHPASFLKRMLTRYSKGNRVRG